MNVKNMILGSAFGNLTEAAFLLELTARQYAVMKREPEAQVISTIASSILAVRNLWEITDLEGAAR